MISKLAVSLGITFAVVSTLLVIMIVLVRHVAVVGEIIVGALLVILFLCMWSATYDALYDDEHHK